MHFVDYVVNTFEEYLFWLDDSLFAATMWFLLPPAKARLVCIIRTVLRSRCLGRGAFRARFSRGFVQLDHLK